MMPSVWHSAGGFRVTVLAELSTNATRLLSSKARHSERYFSSNALSNGNYPTYVTRRFVDAQAGPGVSSPFNTYHYNRPRSLELQVILELRGIASKALKQRLLEARNYATDEL